MPGRCFCVLQPLVLLDFLPLHLLHHPLLLLLLLLLLLPLACVVRVHVPCEPVQRRLHYGYAGGGAPPGGICEG